MNIKSPYRFLKLYYKDYSACRNSRIKFFNYQWTPQQFEAHWLFKFLTGRNIVSSSFKNKISIFSVNGSRFAIDITRSRYKFFYTAENVHVPYSYWQKYEDLLLFKKSINLSLGYDYIEHEKYIRFPYWLMTNFEPDADYQSIKRTCEKLNLHNIDMVSKSRFCSFVCRYDYFGNRKKIYDQISQVNHIDCDGLFMHNNDDLKLVFNDNKREYLKGYKFNLCPENSDYKGYVTEKIFDAISSGCIPIYWGSENNPEPDVLNHNAILFYKEGKNNSLLIKELKTLNENPKLYKEFAQQNRLNNNASVIIYNSFMNLEKRLNVILRH